MSAWYRVFGSNDLSPDPEGLMQHLRGQIIDVSGHFRADDQGWYRAEFSLPDGGLALTINRYLSSEEGIRAELNSWAAWLESLDDGRSYVELMERIIRTTQLFTLQPPDDQTNSERFGQLCMAACQFLASTTDGIYQVDERGLFSADGLVLVPEA